MADEADEALVRVKTLDGQRILVALSGEQKVSDLRSLLLSRRWPLLEESGQAARSFHLIHKGTTLAPGTEIRSLQLENDDDFIACVPFTRKKSDSAHEQAASDVSPASTSEHAAEKRKRADEEAFVKDPSELPEPLHRLERVFGALNSVCGFLERNQIDLTWKSVRSALLHSCTHIDEVVTVEDIKDLALICPKVVVVKNMVGDGENISFALEVFPRLNPGRRNISENVMAQLMERRKFAFEHALHEMTASVKTSNKCDVTLDMLRSFAKELLHQPNSLLRTGPLVYARTAPRRSGSGSRTSKKKDFCKDVSALSASEMIEHLKQLFGSSGQIKHCEQLSSRNARYGELQDTLSDATSAALKQIGVTKLYSHQAAAVNAALSWKSVVVSTSTASGKSLCYNIPVLEELVQNSEACALYLFPTKALAQDQFRAFRDFAGPHCEHIKPGVYDGDTNVADRQILRDGSRVLLSNPDMLHCSILPSHKQFSRFLSNLRYVIIDEAHAYRGGFGCHASLIIRRLRRICAHLYGTIISFIICSATVANPQEHAMELTGLREILSIRDDGSPCGEKLFLLWNPPLRSGKTDDKETQEGGEMKRLSPILEVAALFAEMVQHGLRCITFCKTRKLCELVLSYTHEILKEISPDLLDTIRAYRAGYTPEERRSIEKELFGGKLRGVAATSALELGIDVGSLDATLHLGFPGTVASLWQQAGRAGRRENTSLSIYVAFEGPLDQHFMKEPAKLFSKPIENAHVDSHNPKVLEQHLTCAAFEYPVHSMHDEEYFSTSLQPAILDLVRKGFLARSSFADSWNYIGEAKSPSSCFTIRAIDPDKFSIVNETTSRVIEEVEANKAFFQVFEGAVYINQGKKFLVKRLDLTERMAFCCPTDVKYYTKTRDYTDVHIVGSELIYPRRLVDTKHPITSAQANRCQVTTTWIGFRKIWEGSNQTFDSVDLNLPQVSFESQAAWIRVPNAVKETVEAEGLDLRAGLHAASHALLNVLPLYIMCNPSDVGTDCAHPQDKRYYPVRLLVFDRCPGGVGISTQAQVLFAELLQAAFEQISSCECTVNTGCPNCIQYYSCDEYNEVLDKASALVILQGVIKAENAQREEAEEADRSKKS